MASSLAEPRWARRGRPCDGVHVGKRRKKRETSCDGPFAGKLRPAMHNDEKKQRDTPLPRLDKKDKKDKKRKRVKLT